MRKIAVVIIAAVVLVAGPARAAQKGPDEALFREAKLLLFDKDWRAALDKIEELRAKFPSSAWSSQALFYKGECLNGLGGREREAFEAYKDYIGAPGALPNLVEEAEGRIIDLAFTLYGKGDAAALKEIESRLAAKNDVVRYYAAYKLSLVKDRKVAARAVPVLQRIVETERDPELVDRARIALLRISPESLKSVEDRRAPSGTPRMLRIRIWNKGQKEPAFALNIPWALADLALSAMDESEKSELRKKGYDLNKIMSELAKSKESLVKIVGDDGSVIEIWID